MQRDLDLLSPQSFITRKTVPRQLLSFYARSITTAVKGTTVNHCQRRRAEFAATDRSVRQKDKKLSVHVAKISSRNVRDHARVRERKAHVMWTSRLSDACVGRVPYLVIDERSIGRSCSKVFFFSEIRHDDFHQETMWLILGWTSTLTNLSFSDSLSCYDMSWVGERVIKGAL